MTDAVELKPEAVAVEKPEAAPVVADPVEQLRQENAAQEAADEKYFNELAAKRAAEKDGTAPAKSEPEPTAKADAAAPDNAAPSPAEPAVDPDADLLAAIAPEKRDAVASRLKAGRDAEDDARKARNEVRSMAGRISAYDRKLKEAAGKQPAEVAQAATEEQSDEWKQFAEDYPDIAKAIEKRVPVKAGTTPELAEVVEYVQQEQRSRFLTDAWEAVEAVHPGWREVGKKDEFQTWLQSSPAYGRLASSDDVADAIMLFDVYEAHQAKTGNAGKPTQAEVAESARVAARRSAQVEGARSPNSPGASPNENVDLNDPEQLFAAYAAKANARMKARNS